jgi:hypothetical protein
MEEMGPKARPLPLLPALTHPQRESRDQGAPPAHAAAVAAIARSKLKARFYVKPPSEKHSPRPVGFSDNL